MKKREEMTHGEDEGQDFLFIGDLGVFSHDCRHS